MSDQLLKQFLEYQRILFKKKLLRARFFWNKEFCENCRACNLFSIMLIYFFNDVDIQLILEFKSIFSKYHPVFPKNPKGRFLGHPLHISITHNMKSIQMIRQSLLHIKKASFFDMIFILVIYKGVCN